MKRQPRMASYFRASARLAVLGVFLTSALGGCALWAAGGRSEAPADAKVSAGVHVLLAQSPALGAPNLISVHTLGGVVYLRGIVSTPFEVEQAGAIAAEVPGATHVVNLLSTDNAR
jgi:hypothetical protein